MAGFNRNGEIHPDYGPADLVAPNSKWRDTIYFDGARRRAVESFLNEAKRQRTSVASHIDDADWMVQEYHRQGRLVFLFQKQMQVRTQSAIVTGKDRVGGGLQWATKFHWAPIPLGSEHLRELILCGMWPSIVITPEIMDRDRQLAMIHAGIDANVSGALH
jgi:hypothetical protein